MTPFSGTGTPVYPENRRACAPTKIESPVQAKSLPDQVLKCRASSAKSNKHDNDGALADLTKALELDPRFAAAWVTRGEVKSNKGDNDGAIADYNEAIRLAPNYAAAFSHRGIAWNEKAVERYAL